MQPVSSFGDTSTHGGVVIASAFPLLNGNKITVNGDILECPIHGPNPITATTTVFKIDGIKVVRNNDPAACGATIVTQQHEIQSD